LFEQAKPADDQVTRKTARLPIALMADAGKPKRGHEQGAWGTRLPH
jgi:hypothetical protein